MKILYDTLAFDMQTYGGISNYFVNIFDNIKDKEDIKLPILQTNNEYLLNRHFLSPSLFKAVIEPQGLNYKSFENIGQANQLTTVVELTKFKPDILHTTFYYIPEYDKIFKHYNTFPKLVCTIHDMIPEIYNWSDGEDVQIINKKIICEQSDAIICPSESTKNDIIKYMPNVNPDKIHVVYHGVNINKVEYVNKYNFPYILFIGGRFSYKNWDKFLEESKEFLMKHKSYKIIATGSELTEEEQEYIKDLGLENRIIVKHFTEYELYSLYHYAVCFVFPSEVEGFGMPILEAWQHGCITILNDIPVFKEVGGNASIYFDINTKGSLNNKLEIAHKLTENTKKLRLNKQNKRLQNFSWEKSAEEHLKIYNSLI